MSKRTLINDITTSNKNVKDDSIKDKLPYIDFLSKKVKVRIHYQSGEVVEHTAKITMHYFDIDNMCYMIVPQAFYRKGKVWYCDYYFGNPRPILYTHDSQGIIISSKKLKKELMQGEFRDNKGNIISIQDFEMLPYNQKILFPGVMEVDSVMFNRILTQKAVSDLWGKDEIPSRGKLWVFIGMVVIALVFTFYMLYKKGVFSGLGG